MGKFGIDISNHNGSIDWATLAKEISFVIIRAGYGQNNIDLRAIYNMQQAKKYNVPFGLYWFSYALSIEDAKREANYLCDIADKYGPTYPLCYDWEYDSDKYAKNEKSDTSSAAMIAKAKAFLSTVEERGYYAMLYTNLDYLNKGFGTLTNRFDVWLAEWGVNSPAVHCGIWQTSSKGNVKGISGKVDMDISYNDYPTIIANMHRPKYNYYPNAVTTKKIVEKYTTLMVDYLTKTKVWDDYIALANDIIANKYGTGAARKEAVENLGYNYDLAQIFVTELLNQ